MSETYGDETYDSNGVDTGGGSPSSTPYMPPAGGGTSNFDNWGGFDSDLPSGSGGSGSYGGFGDFGGGGSGGGINNFDTWGSNGFNSDLPDTQDPSTSGDNYHWYNRGLAGMFNKFLQRAVPVYGMGMAGKRGFDRYQTTGSLPEAFGAAFKSAPGPVGALANVMEGNAGGAVSNLVGGPVGAALGVATDGLNGKNVNQSMANMTAGIAGNAMGGPLGGALASTLTNSIGVPPSQSSSGSNNMATGPFNPSDHGIPPGGTSSSSNHPAAAVAQPPSNMQSLFTGLAGLYNATQSRQQTSAMMDQLNAQQAGIPTLDSMFGPNSPYAQNLQQQLARKDAASGRNSQYGARAAQLQAMLADKAMQYGNMQSQNNANYNRAYAGLQDRNTDDRQRLLTSLAHYGQQSGLFDAIGNGLGDLWKTYGPQVDLNNLDEA